MTRLFASTLQPNHLWLRQEVCNFATCLDLGVMKMLQTVSAVSNVLFSALFQDSDNGVGELFNARKREYQQVEIFNRSFYLALITFGEPHLPSSLNVDVDVTCKLFSSLNAVSDTARQSEQPMTVKAAKSNSLSTRQKNPDLIREVIPTHSAAAFG